MILLKTEIVYSLADQITFYAIGLAALGALFYYVIKAAVKSGTKDLLDELRKRRS